MSIVQIVRTILFMLLMMGVQTTVTDSGAHGQTQATAIASRAPFVTPQPSPTPEPMSTVDAELSAAGKAIYLANYCGVCHTLPAAQTSGMFGPDHDHIGLTAAQRVADPSYKGAATTAAEYLHESIVNPSAYFAPGAANGRHPMPPYAHLPESDLKALVYFLLQQQ